MFRNRVRVVGTFCWLLLTSANLQAALVVGAFDASRAGVANITAGQYSEDCIAALSANFPGTTYATTPTLTPEFLSGVDILMLHPAKSDTEAIIPLSASEQTALVDFVKAGGRAWLFAEGENPYIPVAQSFMSPFGVSLVDDGLKGVRFGEPTAPTHPIVDGPFGEVPGILLYGLGEIADLGPYASSIAATTDDGDVVLAAIEAGALGPNSGRVVFMTDSTPFFDADDGGFFGTNTHPQLFLNTINYLAAPEPSTLTLVGAALALGGSVAAIRRVRPWARRR